MTFNSFIQQGLGNNLEDYITYLHDLIGRTEAINVIPDHKERTKEDLQGFIGALRMMADNYEDEISDGQYKDSEDDLIHGSDTAHLNDEDDFAPDKTKKDIPSIPDEVPFDKVKEWDEALEDDIPSNDTDPTENRVI